MTNFTKLNKNKKANVTRFVSISILGSVLTACGGSNNPNSNASVKITGNLKDADLLTSTFVELGAANITYQWQRDGMDIAGATGDTYTLDQVDVGRGITVVASFTASNGVADSVTSAATNIVTVGDDMSLTILDGFNGFRIGGAASGDQSGNSVSNAGDVNGDGYDDIIIGSRYADNNSKAESGSSYVVFGGEKGVDTSINLADLDGTNGFRLDGENAQDYSGYSVSGAGDVNGDGYDDVIVGAYRADPNGTLSGSSYVVFGKADGHSAITDLGSLDGANGFRLDGAKAQDDSGISVSAAGDVNGDGYDDILIGARRADSGLSTDNGSSYIVFGKGDGFSAVMDLANLNGSNGFKVDGGPGLDYSGWSVSTAGDVNGDGYDDIIVGANVADYNNRVASGSSYVVFGKKDGFAASIELSKLNGGDGFRIDGAVAYDKSGWSVSNAGDVNGDGYDDVIIGANKADNNNKTDSGSAYVVFGSANAFAPSLDLGTLDGSNGFRIDGAFAGDRVGESVSSAGDVNGDGYDDIILGTQHAGDGGTSYVIFGKSTGYTANFDLASLDGGNGFKIDGGSANDNSGFSVSAAGDLNNDGYDDIIVGARSADPGGSSYVIYGGEKFASSVQAATAGDDTINGTAAADTLSGGDGNDVIIGLDGNDVIKAGNGDDVITGGKGADKIWGGGGTDTFNITAGESSPGTILVNGSTEIFNIDTIFDFETGDGTHVSETINIAGDTIIAANSSGTDGTDSLRKVDGNVIKSHAITDGIITFDDDDIFSSKIEISTRGEVAAAVDYLIKQDFGDAGSAVAFNVGADTFLYTQNGDLPADGRTLLELEDAYVDALVTIGGTGEFDLLIA